MLIFLVGFVFAGVDDGRVPKAALVSRAEAVSFNVGHKPNSSKWCTKLVGPDGRRCENAQVPISLTGEQRERLVGLLTDKRTFVAADAGCWNPHHAFVLYDVQDVPIAQVNVCFECDQVSRRGVMSDAGRRGFLALFEALGLPEKPSAPALTRPPALDGR